MNNIDNELQAYLNKLRMVSDHAFTMPFSTNYKGRSEIIHHSTGTCIGYITCKNGYQEYLSVLDTPETFVDFDLDYSEGYTLFCMLTGLNTALQHINANPLADAGQYRLWLLRYANHYVVIEIDYNKLREVIREHLFQTTFKLGETYEVLPRRSYG